MGRFDQEVRKSGLFDGLSPDEMDAILSSMGATEKAFLKDEYIFREGDEVTSICIVLQGKVQVVVETDSGEKEIRVEHLPGAMFAESFVCSRMSRIPVSVIARENCVILLIYPKLMMTTCKQYTFSHLLVLHNLLYTLAQKNLYLNGKLDIVTKKTIREKLLTYFMWLKKTVNSNELVLPMNREDLADYLAVNRSAMSRELSKMQDDGLIEIKQNRIILRKN